ncbi:MAG: aldo/keto reductase [Woeseiaceae bacterium]|nr:aldo/keto reductase [Woeseiaceae bacterium]
MATRRTFLQLAMAASLSAAVPARAGGRKLDQRRIPGTDEFLSTVSLGNSNAFRQRDFDTARELLGIYLGQGGRYVDCSGDGALLVASTARSLEHADDVFLGSYFSGAEAETSTEAARQLRATSGKKSLDLMHTVPEDGVPNWATFQRWKNDGLTRYIGVARHNVRYYEMMMKLMATGTADFIQVNLSPLETEAEEQILPMARDMGIAVTINRPFVNGRYFQVVKGQRLPAWATDFDCTSWAQFSIKYVLSHPAVTSVLTETANPEHLRDNLGGGIGRLPDDKTRKQMRNLIQSFA